MRRHKLRIECNITFRCNAICWGCNKAIGLATFEDGDMTVEQIRKAVDQLLEQKVNVTRFTFCGGEPVLHRDLQAMINEVDRLKSIGRMRVLSNGLHVTQKLRDKIDLPERARWVINPLDDLDDPLSGKNDRAKNKWRHLPFWISPKDVGLDAQFKRCSVRRHCGVGLDSTGWSMCGKAVMFGKLLGIDPTMKEGDILAHIKQGISDICQHCQYGLSRGEQHQIADQYYAGEFPDVSETFEKAFKQHKEEPVIQLSQM